MAKRLVTQVPERLNPLATQMPGPTVDPYTQERIDRSQPIKTRGCTVISPTTTNQCPSNSNTPKYADAFTVSWDRPGMSVSKMRPRQDGLAHRIPEGPGIPVRIKSH